MTTWFARSVAKSLSSKVRSLRARKVRLLSDTVSRSLDIGTSYMVTARRAETTNSSLRRLRAALLRLIVVALVSLLLITCRSPGRGTEADSKAQRVSPAGISLVVLISVDQLRADRLDRRLPGGLGWMARSGRVFMNASLEHARTETCSGHATMLTGRQPAAVGLPGNTVVDRERMEIRYCVEDQSSRGAILGRRSRPEEGRSPQAIRVSSLGDWLKAQQPDARVYAVSAKDRAAIAFCLLYTSPSPRDA